MRAPFAVAAALLVLTASASAQEKRERPWSVDVGGTYIALGDQHPTGGWTPTVAARRWGATSERARVFIGLDAAAFGFSSLRWLGFLAGPELGGDYRLSDSWRAGGAIALDAGRIPVCTNWHLCMRYWGFFPRVQVSATHEPSPGVSMIAGVGVRYISTLAWTGASVEPAITLRVGW